MREGSCERRGTADSAGWEGGGGRGRGRGAGAAGRGGGRGGGGRARGRGAGGARLEREGREVRVGLRVDVDCVGWGRVFTERPSSLIGYFLFFVLKVDLSSQLDDL